MDDGNARSSQSRRWVGWTALSTLNSQLTILLRTLDVVTALIRKRLPSLAVLVIYLTATLSDETYIEGAT